MLTPGTQLRVKLPTQCAAACHAPCYTRTPPVILLVRLFSLFDPGVCSFVTEGLIMAGIVTRH